MFDQYPSAFHNHLLMVQFFWHLDKSVNVSLNLLKSTNDMLSQADLCIKLGFDEHNAHRPLPCSEHRQG